MKTILFSFLIVATMLVSCNNGVSEKLVFHYNSDFDSSNMVGLQMGLYYVLMV